MNRQELLFEISEAALFGSLGLFVGTGFSKALTNDAAPSFQTLLIDVCRELSVPFDFENVENVLGKSLPRIAEEIQSSISPDGKRRFKEAIASMCNIHPDESLKGAYKDLMREIPFQWIVTTNYDLILEDLIERSVYLLPSQILNQRTDYVPIYHLHGHRRVPESIIVTEQDYVSLLGPLEYRQLKLTLLLAESTTLMLGYGLGDVNVHTSLEWASRFRRDQKMKYEKYQGQVVQVLYRPEGPRAEPYQIGHGATVVETNSLLHFLIEVMESCVKLKAHNEEAAKIIGTQWIGNQSTADQIAADEKLRGQFIDIIIRFSRHYDVPHLINFLDMVLNPSWEKARADGGFYYYSLFLEILLDFLVKIPFDSIHPSLMDYFCKRMDDVSGYIRSDDRLVPGTSWQASRLWMRRGPTIPRSTLGEVNDYATRFQRYHLRNLIIPLLEANPRV